jgi:ceramide glucosyltransferase
MMSMIDMAAGVWWCLAVAVLAGSFLAALAYPWRAIRRSDGDPSRPVTAIVPVKYWTAQLENDLSSLFAQDHPGLEILVTAAEEDSEALAAVRRVQARFPNVPSRILRSQTAHAASPKLNNLWEAIEAAGHELVLTMDSNVRLAPGDLNHLVGHHAAGVGLVSTISATAAPVGFASWIENGIVNAYHGRMLMLAAALGQGVGCGKVMLFHRADLERAGGLAALAWAVGEDEAMQQAFARIGLKTVLSDRTSGQVLGRRSLGDIWHRQIRWMLIWRIQTPAVFAGDFLLSALPVSLAAALAAPLAGLPAWAAIVETLILWFTTESLLCRLKGWPLSLWSLPAFLAREILIMAARLKALTTSDVVWGDLRLRVTRRPAAVS